ncbi:hypothetical protein OG245_18735 [Streptomyces sp. NBC_01116]
MNMPGGGAQGAGTIRVTTASISLEGVRTFENGALVRTYRRKG